MNQYLQASAELRKAQLDLNSITTYLHKQAWQNAKINLDLWLDKYKQIKSSYHDLQFYKYRNTRVKLLVRLVKGTYILPHLYKNLHCQQAIKYSSTTPLEMNAILKNFYKNLYAQTPSPTTNGTNFLM